MSVKFEKRHEAFPGNNSKLTEFSHSLPLGMKFPQSPNKQNKTKPKKKKKKKTEKKKKKEKKKFKVRVF